MKPWLILLNDFCHDLFTGLWFGSFVTMLLCIVMTGMFRFFYYRDWDGAGMKDVKKRLLIIKHAVLGSSFLIGTGFVLA